MRLISLILPFLIMLFTSHLNAQQKIAGYICNKSNGNIISGATITIKGSKLGTFSDEKGYFEMTLPDNSSWILHVRHISFQEKTITIKQDTNKLVLLRVEMIEMPYQINPMIITSDRMQKPLEDVVSKVEIISSASIESSAANNPDAILQSVPGVFVNRSWGIYSKNASVTMRGFNSASRVLVMLDDVPLNKSGGGGVNWNLLPNSSLGYIEVLKGPSSSIYGNNAMTGTINLITREASDKAKVNVEIIGAQHLTYGASIQASSPKKIKNPFSG